MSSDVRGRDSVHVVAGFGESEEGSGWLRGLCRVLCIRFLIAERRRRSVDSNQDECVVAAVGRPESCCHSSEASWTALVGVRGCERLRLVVAVVRVTAEL